MSVLVKNKKEQQVTAELNIGGDFVVPRQYLIKAMAVFIREKRKNSFVLSSHITKTESSQRLKCFTQKRE
jgi:hypothetical protein